MPFLLPLSLPILLNNKRRFYVDFTAGNDDNSGRSAASPWKTVARVNACTGFVSGDCILFKRGETWTGTRLVVPRHNLHFADYGSGALPLIDGNDTVDCIDGNTKHGCSFHNIAVARGRDYGFLFAGVHDLALSGCTASACGNDNLLLSDGCQSVRITGLVSHSAYQRLAGPVISCLEIADGCHDVTVDGAELYSSAGVGLAIHAHDAEVLPSNILIRNSLIRNNSTHGVQILRIDSAALPPSPGITLQNCTMRNNTGRGVSVTRSGSATAYPSAVTLEGCTIRDNTAAGTYQVELHGADHVMKRCLLDAINDKALGLADVSNLSALNNTIHVENGTLYVGAVVVTSVNNGIDFRNNIVSVGSTQVLVMQVQAGAGTGFSADYNLYYTPSGAGANRWQWNGGGNTTFANWKAQSGQDAHSPSVADPLYTDPAANDYTLQPGSPAIDAGIPIPGVTDGYTGLAPDCGAYEK